MAKLKSICVYCGSSDDVRPGYLTLARDLGRALADQDLKLVYGGGEVGHADAAGAQRRRKLCVKAQLRA